MHSKVLKVIKAMDGTSDVRITREGVMRIDWKTGRSDTWAYWLTQPAEVAKHVKRVSVGATPGEAISLQGVKAILRNISKDGGIGPRVANAENHKKLIVWIEDILIPAMHAVSFESVRIEVNGAAFEIFDPEAKIFVNFAGKSLELQAQDLLPKAS